MGEPDRWTPELKRASEQRFSGKEALFDLRTWEGFAASGRPEPGGEIRRVARESGWSGRFYSGGNRSGGAPISLRKNENSRFFCSRLFNE